jgi:hypothetical protein
VNRADDFVYTSFENKQDSECDNHRVILKIQIHVLCLIVKLWMLQEGGSGLCYGAILALLWRGPHNVLAILQHLNWAPF